MTGRKTTTQRTGIQGRKKRRRAPEIRDLQDCGPDLLSLHKAITREVETLEKLTYDIEEAESEEDQPITESVTTGLDKKICGNVPAETAYGEEVSPSCSHTYRHPTRPWRRLIVNYL